MKVYTMRDLNPMQFFRATASDAKPDASQTSGSTVAPDKKPMTKVPSLLFDIEMDESQGCQPSEPGVEEILERLQHLLQGWSRPEKQLMQLVRKLYEEESRRGQSLEAESLAEVLVQRGDTVTVRTALGGGGGCECLRNLRHVFLSVRIQDAGEAYLVDPKFKEQFEIAHPTERYVELLMALPAYFVGTEERLVAVVELLCSEMSAAFQSTGTTLPPWRQAPSMMSKWRPRRSTDDERRSSLCKPRSGSSVTVNVSADTGGCHRAPVLPAPLPTPGRRPSMLGRLGCDAPVRQAAPSRSGLKPEAVNSRNRASAARTAASLLAVELEGQHQPWKAGAQHIGPHYAGQTAPLKVVNEDDDSPTSVLQPEPDVPPSSLMRWQLRGGFSKADAAAMLYSSTRSLVTGGL